MITASSFDDSGLVPASYHKLRSCIAGVFDDPLFWEVPASVSHHVGPHQRYNGLALHTFEVVGLVSEWLRNEPLLRDIAVTAAIFHDWGKTQQYRLNEDGSAAYTEVAGLLNHVAPGYAHFQKFQEGWSKADAVAVEHAILAHHGRKEWGSPVEPASKVAMLLHAADMISARGWQ